MTYYHLFLLIVGVVGPVGSGKSALLYTLLGELDKVRGRLSVGNFDQGNFNPFNGKILQFGGFYW